MKRVFTKLALSFMAVLLSAKSYAYDFTVDGIYYTIVSIEDMTCEVVKGDEAYKGDIVIPSTVTYNGRTLTVTDLQNRLFYNNSALTSIDLPDGLTTIGEDAFYKCSSLTSIDFPDSLTTIGKTAFYGCTSLTSIDLPEGLTTIGEHAFSGCSSLDSINLPDGLTTIGNYAFSGCSSLDSIDIPNSVTSIGYLLVGSDAKLEKLTIGSSIHELPSHHANTDRYGEKHYYRLFTDGYKDAYDDFIYVSDVSVSNLLIADSDVPLSIPGLNPSYFYKNQIQNIYVGREIDGVFGLPLEKIEFGGYCTTIPRCFSMHTLILGESIETVNPSLIEEQDSLSAIYIKASTPPQLINNFKNKVYINAKLYVPVGAKETYQNADGWKNFWNIEESSDLKDETGISDVQAQQPEVTITSDGITIKESDGAAVSVYSIDGKLLHTATGYQGEKIPLRSGIYIIKVNGNSCKVKI